MTEGFIAPGTIVGDRFLLVRHLGDGGMATVWLARDERTGKDVAVKLLHRRLVFSAPARARLKREAEILTELTHPSIARCLQFDVEAARPFVAMERAEGRTLLEEMTERAARDRRFERHEVIDLTRQIGGALEHAHQRGIVHRDLKPANVMIRRIADGLEVKLLDFGLARLLDQALHDETTQGRRLGSLFYMSPEQARGQRVDARADVFALGTVLFELLTLRRAWVRDADGGFVPVAGAVRAEGPNAPSVVMARMQDGPRPRPSALVPELPVALDEVVGRALAADPAARPPSVEALEREVAAAFGGAKRTTARRPAVLVPLGALMLATALMLFAYAGSTSRGGPIRRARPPPETTVEASALPRAAQKTSPAVDAGEAARTVELPPVRRRRARSPVRPRPGPRLVDQLDELLADLEAHPSDPRRLARLRDALIEAARELEDARERASVERLATSSAMLGDLEAMKRLVARVRQARQAR